MHQTTSKRPTWCVQSGAGGGAIGGQSCAIGQFCVQSVFCHYPPDPLKLYFRARPQVQSPCPPQLFIILRGAKRGEKGIRIAPGPAEGTKAISRILTRAGGQLIRTGGHTNEQTDKRTNEPASKRASERDTRTSTSDTRPGAEKTQNQKRSKKKSEAQFRTCLTQTGAKLASDFWFDLFASLQQ